MTLQNWYRSVAPLNRDQHASLRLTRQPNFSFAATQVSLPLCLEELALAAPFFPIVFAMGETVSPLAVTGLSRNLNLFVDQEGAWTPGVYIPAVARNYPFVVLEAGEGREFVGVDVQSGLVSTDQGDPLFEDGAPTELCNRRAALCLAYRDSIRKTSDFGQALKAAGCLDAKKAEIALPGVVEPLRLNGFAVVNIDRLDQVSDETFLHWRKQGWLTPLFSHLASVGQWQRLLNLAAARTNLAPTAKRTKVRGESGARRKAVKGG